MKIVFIHRMVYQDPLGVMYLAGALHRAGHEAYFVDVSLDKNWLDSVVEIGPDVVGYSVITGNQDFFLDINRRLKQRLDVLSLWGGPHPTFFPEFIEEKGVDVLCIGEGEEAVVELANAIDKGNAFSSIPNLHVKNRRGTVVRNAPRALCQDLDALALPDRSILEHYPQYRCVSTRAVTSSRGCPYSCTFCFNSRLRELYKGKGKYSRRRSTASVIEECRRYSEDPWVEHINFRDDLFARNEDFVHEFAEQYPTSVGLPFACNVRADRMTERIADDLARAGCRVVQFGVESGNDRIRREVLRRPISREAMVNTTRWLQERGVRVYTYNIVGIPGETPAEALETLDFNAELGADIAMFTLFQPYPKTPLGERAVELGWTDVGSELFDSSFYRSSMKHLPHARQFRNMVHLFPLAARSPRLRRLTPRLAQLPLTPAYSSFDFVFKATRFIFSLGFVHPRDIALYSGHWDPAKPPRRRR